MASNRGLVREIVQEAVRYMDGVEEMPLGYQDRLIWGLVLSLPVAITLQPNTPESREGMVMVYDHEGRYLGCMGIERWQRLLVDDARIQRREKTAQT